MVPKRKVRQLSFAATVARRKAQRGPWKVQCALSHVDSRLRSTSGSDETYKTASRTPQFFYTDSTMTDSLQNGDCCIRGRAAPAWSPCPCASLQRHRGAARPACGCSRQTRPGEAHRSATSVGRL
eukprot:331924-Pleurochrysis_carterae.AAC.1